MALSTFVSSLTEPGSIGNQAITGVGFQPKIVLFFFNYVTADGNAAGFADGMGVAVSSTDRRVVYGSENNGASVAAGGNVTASHDNTLCIELMAPGGNAATVLSADFVSMDSDGFTINWTKVDGGSRIVNYMCLGGTDLTNAKTGQFTQKTSTGSQAITGVGFQPDSIILFRDRLTGTAPPSAANSAPRNTIGFGVSASARGFNASHFADPSGVTFVAKGYQRTNEIIGAVANAGALDSEADLTSLDSDGFTLNWSTASSAVYVFYIALKGGKFAIGSFNQPTSNGSQAITGVGFQPTGLILTSDNQAASTSIQANTRFSLGMGSSSTQRGHIWHGGTDGTITSVVNGDLDRANIIKCLTEGASVTTNSAADLTSLDSDGFTLNWGTTDATARQVLYFAVGNSAASFTWQQLTEPTVQAMPSEHFLKTEVVDY